MTDQKSILASVVSTHPNIIRQALDSRSHELMMACNDTKLFRSIEEIAKRDGPGDDRLFDSRLRELISIAYEHGQVDAVRNALRDTQSR